MAGRGARVPCRARARARATCQASLLTHHITQASTCVTSNNLQCPTSQINIKCMHDMARRPHACGGGRVLPTCEHARNLGAPASLKLFSLLLGNSFPIYIRIVLLDAWDRLSATACAVRMLHSILPLSKNVHHSLLVRMHVRTSVYSDRRTIRSFVS